MSELKEERRFYNSVLLAGYVQNYLANIDDLKEYKESQVRVFFFVQRKEGAYFFNLSSCKLYWDDELTDGHFSNADQDELWQNRLVLGEVIIKISTRKPNNLRLFIIIYLRTYNPN